MDPRSRAAALWVPTTTSAHTSRRATTPGISACAWSPTAICSKRSRQARHPVVTDEIETFTEHGIKLRSGKELQADIIVTATGLNLVALGEIQISVDGRSIDPANTLNYKGTMYGGIPNLASTFGYTNASWTLKSELTCDYICRVLNHMEAEGL